MISKKMSFGLSPILKTSEPDPKNLLNKIRKNFIPTNQKSVESLKTTTPDMIDRNIMYAKIFLKPARAIEFIAIDFVITRTGAAFED